MKKFILGLFVFLGSVISFGYCNDYVSPIIERQQVSFTAFESKEFPAGTCFQRAYSNYTNFEVLDLSGNSVRDDLESMSDKSAGTYQYVCLLQSGLVHNKYANTNVPFYYYNFSFLAVNSSSSSCPDTGEILSGYILESEIDNLYCEDHGYCPLINTGIIGTGDWSALFINGIQHEGRGIINVNIADWVVWDYSFDDDQFNLDIGSGYDQDYIDGVIDVQSYRPTSEDFTQTFVGGLILFTPYVIILLFVILVWKLIQRIFKSK